MSPATAKNEAVTESMSYSAESPSKKPRIVAEANELPDHDTSRIAYRNSEGQEEDAGEEDSEEDDDSDGDSSASIEDEEISSLLWPTRNGVKHDDPQEQMQALVQDMMRMREENANLLEQHIERLNKRKASS